MLLLLLLLLMMMMIMMFLADFNFDGFSVDMARSIVAMRDVSFQFIVVYCHFFSVHLQQSHYCVLPLHSMQSAVSGTQIPTPLHCFVIEQYIRHHARRSALDAGACVQAQAPTFLFLPRVKTPFPPFRSRPLNTARGSGELQQPVILIAQQICICSGRVFAQDIRI